MTPLQYQCRVTGLEDRYPPVVRQRRVPSGELCCRRRLARSRDRLESCVAPVELVPIYRAVDIVAGGGDERRLVDAPELAVCPDPACEVEEVFERVGAFRKGEERRVDGEVCYVLC